MKTGVMLQESRSKLICASDIATDDLFFSPHVQNIIYSLSVNAFMRLAFKNLLSPYHNIYQVLFSFDLISRLVVSVR